ncbi:MAG: hypothetical protein JWR44_2267 [Hymenobacter sp.]|nr:hypothetical protein [Hymenobacter sp.]
MLQGLVAVFGQGKLTLLHLRVAGHATLAAGRGQLKQAGVERMKAGRGMT